MVFGNGDDQIDILVSYEHIDRVHKIMQPDKIEFGVEFTEHPFEPVPFPLVLSGQLDIVLLVDIYNMQISLKQTQYGF